MRALVYTESRTLEVLDVATPLAGAGEVLLKVSAAGICGSDVHGVATQSPRRTPPLIMGHELTGEIFATGSGVSRSLVGRQVAVNPQIPCGLCHACRSGRENLCQDRDLVGGTTAGGFAEFVCVPARCVHVLPADLDPDVAVLAEPLATCVHGINLVAMTAPRSAIVFGAGTIGVLAAQMLRLIGTHWILVTDIDSERRRIANEVAESAAPDDLDAAVAQLPGGGAEITVDAVGLSSTRRESLRVLQPSGTALWFGMHDQDGSIPAFDVVVREQRILGSFAYTNPEVARAIELLASGQIHPAVTSNALSLEDGVGAFTELIAGRSTGFLKSIIEPSR